MRMTNFTHVPPGLPGILKHDDVCSRKTVVVPDRYVMKNSLGAAWISKTTQCGEEYLSSIIGFKILGCRLSLTACNIMKINYGQIFNRYLFAINIFTII